MINEYFVKNCHDFHFSQRVCHALMTRASLQTKKELHAIYHPSEHSFVGSPVSGKMIQRRAAPGNGGVGNGEPYLFRIYLQRTQIHTYGRTK